MSLLGRKNDRDRIRKALLDYCAQDTRNGRIGKAERSPQFLVSVDSFEQRRVTGATPFVIFDRDLGQKSEKARLGVRGANFVIPV